MPARHPHGELAEGEAVLESDAGDDEVRPDGGADASAGAADGDPEGTSRSAGRPVLDDEAEPEPAGVG